MCIDVYKYVYTVYIFNVYTYIYIHCIYIYICIDTYSVCMYIYIYMITHVYRYMTMFLCVFFGKWKSPESIRSVRNHSGKFSAIQNALFSHLMKYGFWMVDFHQNTWLMIPNHCLAISFKIPG